jgi:hypothetical protein
MCFFKNGDDISARKRITTARMKRTRRRRTWWGPQWFIQLRAPQHLGQTFGERKGMSWSRPRNTWTRYSYIGREKE